MMARRKGNAIHGWLVIDKPLGPTSSQIVLRVRRALGAAKAGHAGTLDPMATGILPIALGEATKTVSHLVDATKSYRFTVRWGEARDTDDAEGEVVATSGRRPTAEEIRAVLPRFTGLIEQVPPIFSARKVDGARAYDLARQHRAVTLAPSIVRIDRLELVGSPDPDHAEFACECGKGAYMRALARDMAVALGTVGHVARLRRTRVGPFAEKDAISLETLDALGHSAAALGDFPGSLAGRLLAVETVLDDIPALALTAAEANRLRSGQPVGLIRRSDRERIGQLESGSLVCAMSDGKMVAIARFEAGDLRPVRILNL
jgi:tRNA pseudouridine55 synthase